MIVTEERIKHYAARTLKVWIAYQESLNDPAQWEFAKARSERLQQMNDFNKRHDIADEVFELIKFDTKEYLERSIAKRNREAAREIRNRYAATN